MARPKVNPIPAATAFSGPRYAALARVLADEIAAGRFPVGSLLPTEAQLQARFDASRHTVREALRELKQRGLVAARAGIGTSVRARAPAQPLLHGVGTLRDLIQFFEATRMRTLGLREVIADDALADRLPMKVGQQWHEARLLRFGADAERPVAVMSVYVRPEHADVLRRIDGGEVPVHALIERHHGVRLAEVRQRIRAVILGRADGRALRARAGAPALEIARSYLDTRDRVAMIAVGLYPADRFEHATRFRIDPE